MKKFIAMILSVGMIFAVSACGSNPEEEQTGQDAIQVGIVQLIENGAFADMREGFIEKMRELGYSEDKMVFDYKNANGDTATLNAICQSMVDAKKDLIVTIATPPTQAMVNRTAAFPCSLSRFPIQSGRRDYEMNKPDKNATGTSNFIPVDEMFKLADKLTPAAKPTASCITPARSIP
jgi:putative ABC transport system substrate-binding protein